MAKVLILYNSTQTYTQTVIEHLSAFEKYSQYSVFYVHVSETVSCTVDLSLFDAIIVHYSIRLPLDQISDDWAQKIEEYSGFKGLFVQDEYEYTKRCWHWIKRLKIGTVFTCVPEQNINKIYPSEHFRNTTFVNVLTGYVPHSVRLKQDVLPPSKRKTLIAYRARELPGYYGHLGREKVEIGKMVRSYAEFYGHKVDIEWREEARIYGDEWYNFLSSSRAALGTESGSNVFDWQGDLRERFGNMKSEWPSMSDDEILKKLGAVDEPGLMNQISPRLLEAIALRTVLVLYKGAYSGILRPEQHYIPLERDGSNLGYVFEKLADGALLDEISERAYVDIIDSGVASYKNFVSLVESQMALNWKITESSTHIGTVVGVTRSPYSSPPPILSWSDILGMQGNVKERTQALTGFLGRKLPRRLKKTFGPIMRKLFRI